MLAGSVLLPSLLQCTVENKKKSIGLQLYTLRNKIRKDDSGLAYFDQQEIRNVLEVVAKTGFDKLEAFDYKNEAIYNIPYQEFNRMVKDLGMRICSGHYSTGFNTTAKGNLRNDWEQAVADAKEVGQEYVVIPYLDANERKTIDDYKRLCELLNKGAEICQQYGIRMGYHNHDFEFVKIDDQVPYDVMLAELDPNLVSMELDLYWIIRAGYDPLDYFARYPGRFELWHVKDMSKTDPDINVDPGSGSIDFVELFKHAEHAGLKHYFIEQEDYAVSEFESIAKGFEYINTIE